MRILSIEPTPNPNHMKLTVEPALPEGVAFTFTPEERDRAPVPLQAVLAVPGVRSVFQVADFLAVERLPRADWREVLDGVQRAVGAGDQSPGAGGIPATTVGQSATTWGQLSTTEGQKLTTGAPLLTNGTPLLTNGTPMLTNGTPMLTNGTPMVTNGTPLLTNGTPLLTNGTPMLIAQDTPPDEVKVQVQFFRGLPMQVKLTAGAAAGRAPLPPRFAEAAMRAAEASPNAVLERKWVDYGVRYGDLAAVGAEVAAELDAAFAEERLAQLEAQALALGPGEAVSAAEALAPEAVAQALGDPDWRRRYAALDRLEPDAAALPVIVQALSDGNPSVRRLAAVYLGEIGTPEVLPHLFAALKDSSAAVRRAAGDCLSDIGDPAAIGPMCAGLSDPSKLVRWRAARFLYEVGDASALPALRAAADDPEFEVQLQVRLAIERIEG